MKNAGKAYKYRQYRHIRTSKEIIKKSYLISFKEITISLTLLNTCG